MSVISSILKTLLKLTCNIFFKLLRKIALKIVFFSISLLKNNFQSPFRLYYCEFFKSVCFLWLYYWNKTFLEEVKIMHNSSFFSRAITPAKNAFWCKFFFNLLFWFYVIILNRFKNCHSFSSMLKKTLKNIKIFFVKLRRKMALKIIFCSLSLLKNVFER